MGTDRPSIPHSTARLSLQLRPLDLPMPVMEKLRKIMKRAHLEEHRKGKVASLLAQTAKKVLRQQAENKHTSWSFFKKLQKICSKSGHMSSPAKAAGPQCGPEEEHQVKQGK